jgi:pimeloyl-ACP methyl ester carboxylesterase
LSLEAPRAALEYELYLLYLPKLLKLPKGDGQPILILPGFFAGDWSSKSLRFVLEELNYKPFTWGQGTNWGIKLDTTARLFKRIDEIYNEHGKITIIGHSLGGTNAITIGNLFPEYFDKIITLGSPVHVPYNTFIFQIYKMVAGNPEEDFPKLIKVLETNPVIPTTAFISETDCLLPKESCLLEKSELFNVIYMNSVCHCGFIHNPFVIMKELEIIRDKSQHPE